MKWVFIAVVAVIFLLAWFRSTERFVDTEFKSGGVTGTPSAVTKPCVCSGSTCPSDCKAWESKVTAIAPSNAVVSDYISVLAAFYDTVYNPSTTKPTAAQVDTFLASPAGTVSGVDISSLRRIIMDGFHIESGTTTVTSELASQNFIPEASLLEDKMAVDEIGVRKENTYTPAVSKSSTRFSEGDYAPVTQTNPIYPGQWDDGSTTWKGPRPASVCACAENIM